MGLLNDLWHRTTPKKKRSPGDHWDTPGAKEVLDRLHEVNPALAAEIERGRERERTDRFRTEAGAEPRPAGPLHAHEITPEDAAFMRAMRGVSKFESSVTLPSGRVVAGDEILRWIRSQE